VKQPKKSAGGAVLNDLLLSTPWPGMLLWGVLYGSDWYLTMTCARLYQAGVSNVLVYEGSLEITPLYQRDVDTQRRLSPRFLTALVTSVVFVWVVWRGDNATGMYSFILGALVCLELAVHIRHFRNLVSFRAIARGEGIHGRIEYSRDAALFASAVELLTFAGLFAVVFAFTGSPFVFGGVLSCMLLSAQHWRFARRQAARTQTA
jgi:hypothetical protein